MTRTGAARVPPLAASALVPVRTVGAVLQPAVAVRREGHGRGRGDLEAVGQVADEVVKVRGRGLVEGDRRCDGGLGPDDHGAHARGDGQRQQRHGVDRPAHAVPAGADPARGAACEEDDRGGGREQRRRERRAADAQHGESV